VCGGEGGKMRIVEVSGPVGLTAFLPLRL